MSSSFDSRAPAIRLVDISTIAHYLGTSMGKAVRVTSRSLNWERSARRVSVGRRSRLGRETATQF